MYQGTGLGHHEISMPQWISKTRSPLPFLYMHSLVISYNELNFPFVYIFMRKLTRGSEKRKGVWMPSPKTNVMASCTHTLRLTGHLLCAGSCDRTRVPDDTDSSHPIMQFPIPIEEAHDKQLVRL